MNIVHIRHIILLLLFPTLASASMLMQTGFENHEAHTPFTRDLWQEEGFQTASWDQGLKDRTEVEDQVAAQGLHALRVMYPKGEFGPAYTGCQISLLFPSRDEAYASYYLRFSENFSWGTTYYGGKLPGLAGGKNCSGGQNCDGTNGWSARFMWRGGGKLILYLYDMLKPDTYGLDIPLVHQDGSPVVAERGRWYHITERVKMNSSPDKADGEVQAWVDGEEVLFITGRKFTTCDVKIDNFYISTFHGGDDEGWCPTDTCYTFFDGIRVGTTYEDVSFQQCRKPDAGNDQALCAVGSAQLAVDMPAAYRVKWSRDGEFIHEGNRLSADLPGTYIVVADSAQCSQNDTVQLLDRLRVDLKAEDHICASSFVTLQSNLAGDQLSFQWFKDGELLNGETKASLTTKEAGHYRVVVSAENCGESSDTFTLTSGLLAVEDVAGEAGEELEIKPLLDGIYSWWSETGEHLGIGPSYRTTLPQGEHYIFVKDENGFSGTVGKKGISENAWTRSNFDKEFMQFTVERELTIDSISIYPTKALEATLNIVDEATGAVVFSQSYPGLKGGDEARLPLGVTLPAGAYHLDAQGTTAPLYHSHTDSDIHFPYTIEGLISLTGCNLDWINNKGWYMLFYNWHISAGNSCAATPVKLTGRAANGLMDANRDGLFAYQNDEILVIEGAYAGQKITVMDVTGKRIVSVQAKGDEPLRISMERWPKGIYLVNGWKVAVR